MQVSEAQFQDILTAYERLRTKHADELLARKEELYRLLPRYRELDELVPVISLDAGKELLAGHSEKLDAYREQMREIAAEKASLLKQNGFPADYPEMHHDCTKCGDTGFLEDGTRCTCLNEKLRALLYAQSNLDALFEENCFDRMDLSLFEGDDLRRFRNAVSVCRTFIDSFGEKTASSGILFFGPVGSGKSFLSIASAKELLNRGFSVLYFSAIDLFERLSDATFRAEREEGDTDLKNDLTACDLLIIDDLGTEMTNQFVSSRCFHLINERHLHGNKTLISTNLDFEELRQRYSDRTFSRLLSLYTVCELTGGDVRLKRKTV